MPNFQYSYINTTQLVNTNKGNCQPYFHYQTKKKKKLKLSSFRSLESTLKFYLSKQLKGHPNLESPYKLFCNQTHPC